MGRVYNNRTLTAVEVPKLPSPILLCATRPDFGKAIVDAGYQTLSFNLPFAQLLQGIPESDIRSLIIDEIRGVLPQSKPTYLIDYEMLFDPRYELDVFKLFIDLSRWSRLIVKWCGRIEGETLVYAEPGYDDYSIYRISDYDISFVL